MVTLLRDQVVVVLILVKLAVVVVRAVMKMNRAREKLFKTALRLKEICGLVVLVKRIRVVEDHLDRERVVMVTQSVQLMYYQPTVMEYFIQTIYANQHHVEDVVSLQFL